MKSVTDFYAALRQRESSNNYGARNSFGYLGAYQVGEAALIDAGFYYPDGTRKNDWRGTWTALSGVTTEQEFLSNPIAQDRAISYVMAKNWSYIKSLGLTQYVGQTIDGVKITASGMLGGAHLVGIGALRSYLKSGGTIDQVDGNGVSVKEYLILFGDYDVSAETIGDAAKLEDLLRNPNAQRLFCPLPDSSPVGLPKGLAKLLFDIFPSAEAQAAPRRDPLALDLNGDGVISTIGTNAGVYFDHATDGFAELSGWVASGDGIVVRDLNGNGTIDSGKELFGDQTTLPNGTLATNGFEAIAALDSNGDHRVDSLDEHWAELRVWKDINSDGVTDAGELFSMEQAGVSFINTSFSATNQTDANGNIVAQRGSFGRSDGGTGAAASLLFDQNSTDTVAHDYVEVPDSIQALPDLDGFGNVHSLRQSMARDSSLAASVSNLIGSADYKALRAQFEAVVLQWAGATDVAPNSRGANIDGRKLAVLEAFYGQGFMGVGGSNPNANAALLLNDAYTKLLDGLYAQYLPQAQLKAVWSQVELQWDDGIDRLSADFSKALPAVHELLGNQPSAAVQLLYEFAKSAKQFGLDTSAGFADFKAAFDGSSFGYDKVLQAGLDGATFSVVDATTASTVTEAGLRYVLGTAKFTGSAGSDSLFGGSESNSLDGGQGGDSLYGGSGTDTLDGGYDSDLLDGGDGDDVLGGAVNGADYNHYAFGAFGGYTDAWRAASGGNTYRGGAGNDTLRGTLANDTYLFNLGDGNDTIIEETSGYGGVTDKLVFGSGIAAADVSVTRSGNDLVLRLANGTDSIKVQGWFNSTNALAGKLELVQFADGTTWTGTQLSSMGLAVSGSAGDDTLNGTSGFANVIDGGDGNDVITGGSVGDTLLGGAGNDSLNGLQGADSLYGGSGSDTLDGGYDSDLLDGGDGDDVLGGAVSGADYNHYAYGSFSAYTDAWRAASGGNTYRGGAGNDTLRGTLANDTYLFNLGDGNDTIIEETAGNGGVTDKLVFGSGITAAYVSVMRTGNDLVLKLANGTDSIRVQGWFNSTNALLGKLERVEFADGTVWTGTQLSSMGLAVSGSAGDDSLNGTSLFANVIDGGDGNDVITGGTVGDTLLGGAGNDTLNGMQGADSLYGGTGNDTLDGGYDSDLLEGGDGDDLLGGASGSSDYNHYAYGAFGGYTDAWRAAQGGNTYRGGAGSDTLRGTLANDTYLFSLGDGNDTIIEETSGYGGVTDKLVFGSGIAAADVSVTRAGNDLVLKLANGTDSIKVQGWFNSTNTLAGKLELVQFADGTSWTGAQLSTMALAISGTAGDDSLNGTSLFANVIDGGDGNDVITGGTVGDTLLGGAGNDTLNGLQGADSLYGGTGNDTLDGGYDSDLLDGGEGDDVLGGAVNGADYNHYAYGAFGGYTDAWRAAQGGNTYRGGAGNDTLRGTLANDTYMFSLGDGNDTIIEETSGYGGVTDKLVFGSGITAADVSVTRSGNDLVLKLANGTDSIKVQGWFNSTNALAGKLELVQFVDGTTWTGTQLSSMGLAVSGSAGDDSLNGTSLFANVIDGGDGNDVITGGTVGDTLLGGAGNDTLNGLQGADGLYGGTGNDTLDGGYDSDLLDGGDGDDVLGGAVNGADYNHYAYGSFGAYTDAWRAASGGNTYRGGAGNDTLRGTLANDIYLFNLGDGNDTIIEETSGYGGVTDKLVFGSGIAAADVSVTRAGNDLVLKLANGTDSIKVQGWFNSTNTLAGKLELVQFADGTTWTGAQLTAMGLSVTGSAGNDSLTGLTSFANTLYGLAGNDTLNGGSLADILYGGEGADLLQGGAGDDDYRYFLGDGVDTINDSAGAADILRMDGLDMSSVHYWKQGNDLCIEAADGQSVLVKNHFLTGNANRIENFYFNGILMSSNDMALMAQPRS